MTDADEGSPLPGWVYETGGVWGFQAPPKYREETPNEGRSHARD